MSDDEMAGEREFNERNIEEFRRNGGKVGGQFEGFPLLLLTSTGAKSSAERLNLIGYFDIDDKIYIVGSAAGRDASPAWVFNLRDNPSVQVEIGADPPKPVVAHELPRDERDRIFADRQRTRSRIRATTRSAPIASSRSSNLPPTLNQRRNQ